MGLEYLPAPTRTEFACILLATGKKPVGICLVTLAGVGSLGLYPVTHFGLIVASVVCVCVCVCVCVLRGSFNVVHSEVLW